MRMLAKPTRSEILLSLIVKVFSIDASKRVSSFYWRLVWSVLDTWYIKEWVVNISRNELQTRLSQLGGIKSLCNCFIALQGEWRSIRASTMAPWRSCAFNQFWCGVFSWPTLAKWKGSLGKYLDTTRWPPRLLASKLAAPRLGRERARLVHIIWCLSHTIWREGEHWWCLRNWEKHTTNPRAQVSVNS